MLFINLLQDYLLQHYNIIVLQKQSNKYINNLLSHKYDYDALYHLIIGSHKDTYHFKLKLNLLSNKWFK